MIRKQPRSIIEKVDEINKQTMTHKHIYKKLQRQKEVNSYSVNLLFENLFTFLGGGEGVGVKRSKCLGNFFRFFFFYQVRITGSAKNHTKLKGTALLLMLFISKSQ